MIYVTGDTHGEFRRFASKRMKKHLNLTEKDYVIVCGDFGLCWADDGSFAANCKFFEEKPYTVLWVQGNHENYDMIKGFPEEEWHGGRVRHIVRDKVILLERGQVFEMEGKILFTFGGASSHDMEAGVFERSDPKFRMMVKRAKKAQKTYRVMRETWWPEELPTPEEMQEGLKNLEKVNNQVDYVITHCCSTGLQKQIAEERRCEADALTEYFQQLEEIISYRQWYFGHYHEDRRIDGKHTLLYRQIVEAGTAAVLHKDDEIISDHAERQTDRGDKE